MFTDKKEVVEVPGATIDSILKNLTTRHPRLQQQIFSEDGRIRSFINVYLNDDDIRYLQQGSTRVKESDTVSIIPSIAGGADVGERVVVEELQLSHEETLRYSRHLIMPEVGIDGQKKLKAASVLIIGAGGLGSPASMYLAAAGVGRIGLVDFDVVDLTNLQRQILHSTRDVGKSKLNSARETLLGINPQIEVQTYEVRLTSENALDILQDYDVIVDGTDNFPTRYLVNDACVLLGKPNVYGSIFRFDGQVSVFNSGGGPCYRCLYPAPPPPDLVPNCAEGGVLGVLPGIIGSLQALEAIKIIIGTGESLVGRLLLLDALKMHFRELRLRKNPECSVCGEHPTIRALIDYEEFCGVHPVERKLTQKQLEISVEELKARLDRGDDIFLLDVREAYEREICNMGGFLIPLTELPGRIHELDTLREIVVYCRTGNRSAKAIRLLQKNGFRNAKNLAGGTNAWAERVDRNMAKY